MKKQTRRVAKYEVGRTIGEGTFAKVRFAQNRETGESVAMKVLAKSTILKHRMVDQVHQGRLLENDCRRYFQQLIDAVAHCHSKGVYHRDLKPENLLLDSYGNLKVSDFGLSALPQQGVELLHTTCGTPNYVAPEVLSNRGYDGSAADVWSCGVILFVLMAGYLPFGETDLPTLYKKRIRIEGIRKHPWFRKNYNPVKCSEEEEVNLDDVHAVFDDIEDQYVAEQSENKVGGPLLMNAFEMITLSQGLNLAALFDRRQDYVKRQTRFVSRQPAQVILSNIEAVAESLSLKVHTRNYKTRLEGVSANKTGQFAVVLEVFEVAPSLFMVDVRKAAGDTLEYHKFYKNFCAKLENIIWKPTEGSSLLRTMSC
ncbi:CBL-interacting serine/threonine-protein kinase 24 [Citrus sinensis]|uniref:CBL-interacting serine/threonine-protein kinase 24 n=1 Tax=Citrus sinensis TaxID=2711 RepID=A0ACB8NQU4_CITSI|nr:CBL-interacting serine/threonine-protein kinase 24 [Citrus sinensis]